MGGIHAVIINQTESKALPPSCDKGQKLLLPGYSASKLHAEKIVLAVNGRPLANGKFWPHKVSRLLLYVNNKFWQ
jgi:hypothetical protein